MKYLRRTCIKPIFLIFFWISGNLRGQVWWEETGNTYDYDLSKFRLLIPLGEDFDYYETMVIKEYWERWGARVDIAGTARELTGHLFKRTKTGWDRSTNRTIPTDLLLSTVDVSKYQALFLPGGSSPKNLLKADSVQIVQLIQNAQRKGLVLGAICHGP